jgi:hypothetical protein
MVIVPKPRQARRGKQIIERNGKFAPFFGYRLPRFVARFGLQLPVCYELDNRQRRFHLVHKGRT